MAEPGYSRGEVQIVEEIARLQPFSEVDALSARRS